MTDAELNAHLAQLTPREREALNWLVRGRSNREIGERMSLQTQSVKTLLHNTYRKLGVHSRQDAQRLLGR